MLLIFWQHILSRINIASKTLQGKTKTLNTAVYQHKSLGQYIRSARLGFDKFEIEAQLLIPVKYDSDEKRQKKGSYFIGRATKTVWSSVAENRSELTF